jgi:hypothetical protein
MYLCVSVSVCPQYLCCLAQQHVNQALFYPFSHSGGDPVVYDSMGDFLAALQDGSFVDQMKGMWDVSTMLRK